MSRERLEGETVLAGLGLEREREREREKERKTNGGKSAFKQQQQHQLGGWVTVATPSNVSVSTYQRRTLHTNEQHSRRGTDDRFCR